jgi:NADPH:quinone reductase-like Zn-dependent oxidoreductase
MRAVYIVPLARHLGAHVATTAGAANSATLKALGADEVIDYRNQPFEEAGGDFDVVFDTVGGDTQRRSYGVLRPGGVLVTILGAPQAQEQARRHGVRVESFFMRPDGDQLTAVARLVESGDVQPVIDRGYPLEQARQALLYSRSGRANGKIIIRVR